MSVPVPDLSTTPRLYVAGPLAAGVTIALPPAQAHYVAGVMRRTPGDWLRLFDGSSGEWAARVETVAKKSVTLAVVAQSAPPEVVPDLWLCAAPLKRGRIDWVAEKACELGVARLVPMITARTIVDRLNLERLKAHMVEAAEQCGRTALPVLSDPLPLATLLRDWPAGRALVFADEAGGEPLTTALARAPAPAAVLIGPEGGFTPDERAAIRARPEAVPVSLGPRILRADTAAVAAVAVWQAVAGT